MFLQPLKSRRRLRTCLEITTKLTEIALRTVYDLVGDDQRSKVSYGYNPHIFLVLCSSVTTAGIPAT
jgi:hypothetical protein